MVVIALISNLSLLVALSVISEFIGQRWKTGVTAALLQGLVFGGAAVIGMLEPLVLGPGLIFDGRSVMISLCGLFFGPLAVTVASAMAFTCRVLLGGVGVYMGVLVIASSAVLGNIYHGRRIRQGGHLSTLQIFEFGLIVHLAMLLLMFALPLKEAFETLNRLGLAIMLTYPLATVAIGRILSNGMERDSFFKAMQAGREELGATLYSIGDAVISTDGHNRVTRMNPVAERLTGWTEAEARGRALDEVFAIVNEKSREKVENPARKVLAEGRVVGLANHTLLLARNGTEYPIADSGAPIRGTDGRVSGVVLVFRDQTEERRAEEALRHSERRLSTLIGNLPGMAYRCNMDADWTMQFVSEGAAALTGYAPEDLLFNRRISYASIIHPDDRQMVWDEVVAALDEASPFTLEYRIVTANGKTKWVWERGCALMGPDGEVEALEGFISDVTSLKKAREEALRAKRDWEDIFQAIGHLTLILDKEHNILDANRAATRITGLSAKELCGMKCYEVLHMSDSPPANCPLTRMRRTGRLEIEEMEVEVLNRWFLVSCTPVYDGDGNLDKIIHIATDVTERKQALLALRQSEEHFRDLFQRAPLGYQSLDAEGRFLEINDTWLDIMGYAREEVVGRWFGDFLVPEQVAAFRERFPLLKEKGRIHSEFRMLHKDGSVRAISFEGSVATTPDGAFSKTHCILSDVTQAKLLEEEKAAQEAISAQISKAESLGRMAGAIAHRFNNHLMAVTGNLEVALLDLPKNSSPAESLSDALDAARKAAELSRLMLTYLGQTPARREPVDISDLCKRTLAFLAESIPRDTVLEADLPSPGPVLNANPGQIEQIVANLVANSHESFPDGRGHVRVSVKNVRCMDIPVAHRFPAEWRPSDDTCACLEVSDTGSGIKREDIPNLFDPFFSSKFTGRGLGLPVVLGIARAHRGAVTVESEPGRGSVFRVYFPLSGEEIATKSERAAVSTGASEGGRVLLVEDDDLVRQLTSDLLKRLHYEVVEARNGQQALELFQQNMDDIRWVLCDLTMPGMDGWETMAALRRLSPGIPVILVSGYDEARVMMGDHPEWPQAFLSKPYHIKQLKDAIAHALAHR
ncbi:MAG: PAS domain S-box protein [Deltaproteobacteria bacterium]|nr:PAS domain S-box protein [Deltaproteobacteria bacterium]